jgi:hypothetical protein
MRSVVAPERLTKGTMIARDWPARVMGSVFVNASLAECQVAQLLQSGNPRELLTARRALTKPPKPPKGGFGGFGGLCTRYILTNFDALDAAACIHSQGSSITKCVFVFLDRTVYTVWLTACPPPVGDSGDARGVASRIYGGGKVEYWGVSARLSSNGKMCRRSQVGIASSPSVLAETRA